MPKRGRRQKHKWRKLDDSEAVKSATRRQEQQDIKGQESSALFEVDKAQNRDGPISRAEFRQQKREAVLFCDSVVSMGVSKEEVTVGVKRSRSNADRLAEKIAKRKRKKPNDDGGQEMAVEEEEVEPTTVADVQAPAQYDMWSTSLPPNANATAAAMSKKHLKIISRKEKIIKAPKIVPEEAGISYRPDTREHKKVLKERLKHVKMEEKKRRREQLMKPSPEMEHERGVYVDDGEEIPADRGGEKKKKKPKRKTRSQRNKEKRRRLEAFMEAKQRAEAKRKEALKSLPEVVQEIEEEQEGREEYMKAKLKRRQELRDRRMRQGRVRREKKLEAYLLDDEIPQSMLETAHPFVRARRMWYARDWLTRETGVSGTDARHVFGAGREKADRAYEETAQEEGTSVDVDYE